MANIYKILRKNYRAFFKTFFRHLWYKNGTVKYSLLIYLNRDWKCNYEPLWSSQLVGRVVTLRSYRSNHYLFKTNVAHDLYKHISRICICMYVGAKEEPTLDPFYLVFMAQTLCPTIKVWCSTTLAVGGGRSQMLQTILQIPQPLVRKKYLLSYIPIIFSVHISIFLIRLG